MSAPPTFELKSANWAGVTYKNPGVSEGLRNWKGQGERKTRTNTSRFSNASTDIQPMRRPEGATLRKWDEDET
jgi:hypothetical protein